VRGRLRNKEKERERESDTERARKEEGKIDFIIIMTSVCPMSQMVMSKNLRPVSHITLSLGMQREYCLGTDITSTIKTSL
jgi:hypothetical protein